MVHYVQKSNNYYQKCYKNGKKVRVSRKEYMAKTRMRGGNPFTSFHRHLINLKKHVTKKGNSANKTLKQSANEHLTNLNNTIDKTDPKVHYAALKELSTNSKLSSGDKTKLQKVLTEHEGDPNTKHTAALKNFVKEKYNGDHDDNDHTEITQVIQGKEAISSQSAEQKENAKSNGDNIKNNSRKNVKSGPPIASTDTSSDSCAIL